MGERRPTQFEVQIGVHAHVKVSLGLVHMEAARDFARRCADIENDQKDLPWPQPRYREADRYALGSVILSVAAIEAGINETYQAAVDSVGQRELDLPQAKAKLLAVLWNDVEQFPLLRKYQVALVACGKEPFDAGAEPYQSAQNLIRLRNALVHFKPEWDDDRGDHHKLEQRLKSRFEEAQTWKRRTGSRAWFPDRCLGAGCAKWACDSAQALHDEFCNRIGIDPVLG